jgi:hypothetical protein
MLFWAGGDEGGLAFREVPKVMNGLRSFFGLLEMPIVTEDTITSILLTSLARCAG